MGMRRFGVLVGLTLGIGLVVGNTYGDTVYVDDDGPADFDNIQAAIDDASEGDTVIVEKGLYVENINFKGKNIILISTNPNDPSVVATTIIDGNNLNSVVTFTGTENASCILSGFTIQNGYQDIDLTKGGGGICGGSETIYTHATIVSNTIIRNFAWDGGGLSRCDGLIEKNLIAGNTARWWQGGGGLYQCNGVIRNNIIVGNYAGGCDGAGAISNCNAAIENCTIAYNITNGLGVIDYCNGTIRNCIIWANTPQDTRPIPSFSCTDIDPRFADPGYWDPNDTPDDTSDDFFVPGDYHLISQGGRFNPATQAWVYDDVTSPCIDDGDPMSPIGYEPFPNGGVINMGAYGGTDQASKSYFGTAPCEIVVAGDINGDCVVNLLDFYILALHWCENNNP